jgi:hypothetical protein
LSRIGFAAVALACIGALFATQQIKEKPPLVNSNVESTGPQLDPLSPDKADRAVLFSFVLSYTDHVSVTIVAEPSGRFVAVPEVVAGTNLHPAHGGNGQLLDARALRMRSYSRPVFRWNGRTASGALAPRGGYAVKLHMDKLDRTLLVPGISFQVVGTKA